MVGEQRIPYTESFSGLRRKKKEEDCPDNSSVSEQVLAGKNNGSHHRLKAVVCGEGKFGEKLKGKKKNGKEQNRWGKYLSFPPPFSERRTGVTRNGEHKEIKKTAGKKGSKNKKTQGEEAREKIEPPKGFSGCRQRDFANPLKHLKPLNPGKRKAQKGGASCVVTALVEVESVKTILHGTTHLAEGV